MSLTFGRLLLQLTESLTVFEVQLIMVVIFLAFVVLWVTIIEPALAEKTGPARHSSDGGDAE